MDESLLPLLILAVFVTLSLPALAQPREVGGGFVPSHGPAPFHGTPRPAEPHPRFAIVRDIPKRLTFTTMVNGSDTTMAG